MAETAATGATTAPETAPMEGGKRSRWLSHVKKTMRAHKGKSLKQVLKMAKKTYKGGAALSPADYNNSGPKVGGRRTRKASKKGGRRHK
jgi:hypothetical protein